MSHFLIHIFDFFKRRRALLWTLLTGIVALLTVSALRISFVEDISSFLPNNADSQRINEAYQHIGATNKIIVTISANGEHADEELLTDAAVRFAEILQASDSVGHIKDLICEINKEKISEVTNFITQNLPLFLEEEDYARIDSLIQPQNIENQLKADKEWLMSPMGGFVRDMILHDPLHFSQNVLKNLEFFKYNDNYNTDNGFIFNSKGECIVTVTSKYPASETANNKLLANEIYSAVRQTAGEFNNEIKIVPFGAALISITNADQIKNDSIFAVSIALVLILTLLFYFFRDLKPLFFISVSVAFGALFSLGVMMLFHSTISIIAIGISSVIFGIAINYPLHFLAHNRYATDTRRTLREIINPLLIGNITTVAAFLSLLFISSPAMHDLGLFSSLLLVGTIIFVLIFLPQIVNVRCATAANYKSHFFSRLAEFSPEKYKLIVLVFLIFTVILFFFSFGTKFETNLQAINYMTDEQRTEINKLIEENQGKGKTIYCAIEGLDIQSALYNYERQVPAIMKLIDSSLINNTAGIGNFFPSEYAQKQKIKYWSEFWENKKEPFLHNFNKISEKQSFNPGIFDDFVKLLNEDLHVRPFEYFEPLYKHLNEHYFAKTDDGRTLIYTVFNTNNPEELKLALEKHIKEPILFDEISIAQKMVNALSSDFNNILYICGFVVFIFLLFSFGRIELSLLSFLPLAVGWIWILGLMQLGDIRFNIVNIILATFIFGQGDDYTIFITEGLMYEYAYRRKMLASYKNSILLSALIMFIGMGTLIFAKHPALKSLAEVTVVGMFSVVLMAYLIPPAIFHWLTKNKRAFREIPLTFKRLLSSLYSFIVFLIGCLLLTLTGLFILGVGKKTEKKKQRYHSLLCGAARYVIKRIPGVKFNYENLSGETFEKPAIIISNHQSHLDLMCLMMLTPRLIILTNNRVWNNPFYGRLIKYADFYPVSSGIENSVKELASRVQNGYSIVVFPEGTRSANSSIMRFHRGAFFLAETLKLDVLPVFIHGAGDVLPKNDFMLRTGSINVQVHPRISPDDARYGKDYPSRTKQIRQYYRQTYASLRRRFETATYFKNFVLHNYFYKGAPVERSVRKTLQQHTCYSQWIDSYTGNGTVLIENSGYGAFAFLFAMVHKHVPVVATEEDEDKVALARNCAGKPGNLSIYKKQELPGNLFFETVYVLESEEIIAVNTQNNKA